MYEDVPGRDQRSKSRPSPGETRETEEDRCGLICFPEHFNWTQSWLNLDASVKPLRPNWFWQTRPNLDLVFARTSVLTCSLNFSGSEPPQTDVVVTNSITSGLGLDSKLLWIMTQSLIRIWTRSRLVLTAAQTRQSEQRKDFRTGIVVFSRHEQTSE